MDELNTYFQSLGIPTPSIVSVSVGRAVNLPRPGQNSPDDEVLLDIEVVGAVGPGRTDRSLLCGKTLRLAGSAPSVRRSTTPSTIRRSSRSVGGGPESTWTSAAIEAINYEFQVAGSLGITICTAAGDSGYTDGIPGSGNVDFPASSPYVLACGGTFAWIHPAARSVRR